MEKNAKEEKMIQGQMCQIHNKSEKPVFLDSLVNVQRPKSESYYVVQDFGDEKPTGCLPRTYQVDCEIYGIFLSVQICPQNMVLKG